MLLFLYENNRSFLHIFSYFYIFLFYIFHFFALFKNVCSFFFLPCTFLHFSFCISCIFHTFLKFSCKFVVFFAHLYIFILYFLHFLHIFNDIFSIFITFSDFHFSFDIFCIFCTFVNFSFYCHYFLHTFPTTFSASLLRCNSAHSVWRNEHSLSLRAVTVVRGQPLLSPDFSSICLLWPPLFQLFQHLFITPAAGAFNPRSLLHSPRKPRKPRHHL